MGTRVNANPVRDCIQGYSNAAVTANQWLTEWVAPFDGRILAVKVYGTTAGTGAGNTVVDVFLNGTSIWATAGNRPTLLATSTGEFASTTPTTQSFRAGDRIGIQVASVSTTGHARLMAEVATGMP